STPREEKARDDGQATTRNFVVEAPTERVAQLIADAAEAQRKLRAVQWLGKELPPWSQRCTIRGKITMDAPGGRTLMQFQDGQVSRREMSFEGPLDQLLSSIVPHETTHLIFAEYFRGSAHRWADEGGAVLSEAREDRQRQERMLRRILLEPGRAIPLR